MPKHWVRIDYATNPHPSDPCDAYKHIFAALAAVQAVLDEMLFDLTDGKQYLLVTTFTSDTCDVLRALERHSPEIVTPNVSALGEIPASGMES